jgi:hypothetical protein
MRNTNSCIMCGSTSATLWTLNDGGTVAVTYLCKQDAAPIVAVMAAAGTLAPARQKKPRKSKSTAPVAARRRRQAMEPLLDWAPPAA